MWVISGRWATQSKDVREFINVKATISCLTLTLQGFDRKYHPVAVSTHLMMRSQPSLCIHVKHVQP